MPLSLYRLIVAISLLHVAPGRGAVPLPADPGLIIGAGQDLLAVTIGRPMWRRAVDDGADWQQVAPLPGEEGFSPSNVRCAGDNSGFCLITLSDGRTSHVDLFRAGQGLVRRIPLNGWVDAFADKDTAYLIRDEAEGKRVLYRYRIGDGLETRVGSLQLGQPTTYLPIDGVMAPVTRPQLWQLREVSDKPDAALFNFGQFDNMVPTRDGAIVIETWGARPAREGRRYLGDVRFVRGADDGRSSRGPKPRLFLGFPTSGPLPFPVNAAADANNDVVLEMVSPDRRQLGVLCQAGKNPGLKYVGDLPTSGITVIGGGESASGFILTMTGRMQTPGFQMLRLSASQPGGWRTRSCDATTATITDANVKVEQDEGFEMRSAEAVSADGTHVPYVLLIPKGAAPRHVIIDVYGAFGVRRETSSYPPVVKRLLADGNIAVAFPVVRGDGDKGIAWAMASHSPHRQLAVDDVIAVAKDIKAQLPSLQTLPTVRGMSAGGWLAVKAVLQRPDLFAGAIGFSGLYLPKGEPVAERSTDRFFDPALDDLTPDVSALKGNCHALHFRLLHARDDQTVSFSQAGAFLGLLKAQGCAAELIAFDAGGHLLAFAADRLTDFERLRAGYFTPF